MRAVGVMTSQSKLDYVYKYLVVMMYLDGEMIKYWTVELIAVKTCR